MLVASLPVVLYFTTLGTWRLTHQRIDGGWTAAFFWQQAESMLVHARLDVDPAAFGIECFMRDERCYGYFGVTPSLVRIPFLGISRFFHSALTPVFLAAAIVLGVRYAHLFTRVVDNMKTRGRLIIAATTFALLAGYAAESVGVAAIVGAFAAGLILARTEHQARISEKLRPVADVFVPIFFVMVGVAVDLSRLNPFHAANWPVLGLAGALTVAAIAGKLVSGWGAMGPSVNRLAIGVGMLPRGEVGLIFAGVGLSHQIIAPGEYSALLLVIVLTTFLAPILLKRVLHAPA